MALTTNYSFDKSKRGHQIVSEDIDRIADNLVLIDTAIKDREDDIATLQKGVVTMGNIDITEATVWVLPFPFKVTINKVYSVVSIALSANETAVTLRNNASEAMDDGLLLAASRVKGGVDTATPVEHNVIGASENLEFVSDAACSTGKIIAVVHYTRTA